MVRFKLNYDFMNSNANYSKIEEGDFELGFYNGFKAGCLEGIDFWIVDVKKYLTNHNHQDNTFIGVFLRSKEYKSLQRENKLKRVLKYDKI